MALAGSCYSHGFLELAEASGGALDSTSCELFVVGQLRREEAQLGYFISDLI